jgi:type IV pilus assembly protein PilQ
LRYARTDDIKSILEDLMDKAAGESVTTSGKLNAVVITARPAKMRMLARILRSVDTPPAQVMVEAKIIELKSGSGDTTTPSSMGINWKLVSQNNPHDFVQQLTQESFNYGATSMGLYGQAQLLEGNLNAYLSALEKAIGYDLLASPTVTALNHEEAEILIGSKYGYKTTTTTQTGTSETVNFLDVGTKLKFTPHINDQEFIIMDIYPAVSEGSVVNGLPQENTTETRNRVLVKDGQSIIIGGLTKTYHDQVEYGIPILMHLPIIGAFFRRTQVKSEKREIMIIITPKIVTAKALELMSEKTKKMEKKQNQEAGAHGLIHFH